MKAIIIPANFSEKQYKIKLVHDLPNDQQEASEIMEGMISNNDLYQLVNDNQDIVVETDKPCTVKRAFGENLVSALDDISCEYQKEIKSGTFCKSRHQEFDKALKGALEKGVLTKRMFCSQEAADAYEKGIADMNGWCKTEDGKNYDWIPENLWNEES